MNDMNEIVISGQVVEPPRMASTQSGKMVCKMRLKSTQERNGRESSVFIDVDVWEAAGASYANTIPQGASVVVSGRFSINTWQDQNGNKRSTPVVVANAILPLAVMQMAPQSQYCQPQYYQQGVPMPNGGQYAPPQPPPMTYQQYQQNAAPYVNNGAVPAPQPAAQTQQPVANAQQPQAETKKDDDVPF